MTSKIQFDLDTVRSFIAEQNDSTRYYIGCDSSCFRKHGKIFGTFVSVLVIHKNGNNGCKLFGKVETEQIYTPQGNHSLRLMTEVYKVAE